MQHMTCVITIWGLQATRGAPSNDNDNNSDDDDNNNNNSNNNR